jgi:uncharacterized protein (TIRG00374 family)
MRKLHFLAGVAVSSLALFIVVHDVAWGEVLDHIEEADDRLVALAVLVQLGSLTIRTLRWRLLLQSPPGVRLWDFFGSINVAYFLNNLLPLQVGDIGRSYLLSEIAVISMTRTLSTIIVERVLDVLTLLGILLFLALFIDIPSEVRIPSGALAAVFSTLGLAIFLTANRPRLALSLVDNGLRLAPAASRPKLRSMADSALDGFAAVTDARVAPAIFALSATVWLSTGVVVYTGMQAFDLPLGYGPALFIVVATTFGFFVPSTPGSFGVYHAIVTAVLVNVWNIDYDVAVGFALVMHLVFYLPPMALGPLFLWLERGFWERSTFFDKLRQLRGEQPEPVAK